MGFHDINLPNTVVLASTTPLRDNWVQYKFECVDGRSISIIGLREAIEDLQELENMASFLRIWANPDDPANDEV